MDSALDLYYDGREKLLRNDLEGAIVSLGQSIAIVDHFKTRELLAECLELSGDNDRAIIEYRQAVALNPRSNKTAVSWAKLLVKLGQMAEARQVLTSVLDRVATYGPAKRLLEHCSPANDPK